MVLAGDLVFAGTMLVTSELESVWLEKVMRPKIKN